jgi:hypothetical protein
MIYILEQSRVIQDSLVNRPSVKEIFKIGIVHDAFRLPIFSVDTASSCKQNPSLHIQDRRSVGHRTEGIDSFESIVAFATALNVDTMRHTIVIHTQCGVTHGFDALAQN